VILYKKMREKYKIEIIVVFPLNWENTDDFITARFIAAGRIRMLCGCAVGDFDLKVVDTLCSRGAMRSVG
jgi:hypothetical protein